MSTLLGTALDGRYRLDRQVGSGGMSTVYCAFDATLERFVAIKLMHREIASDSDQLTRFRREARAVAQLSHPHIVGVIDAGEEDGRPYIVFEFIPGETLKERIRRQGRLPIEEAIAYAIEIARALTAAHARGIVHRDVKPQNVLIDAEGSAKVTDFGIARVLDEDGLTADGRVLGTTDYVSPEQALGHDVNGQSDLYSLGVVLYEMLVGQVPFHGDNQVAVAMKHVREDLPDVQSRRPEVSASLAAIVDRLTDKDLGRRYPDARTVVAQLETALAVEAARSGQTTGEATAVLRTLPESTRRGLPLRLRWRVPLVGLLLIVAVAAVIGGFLVKEARDSTTRGTGLPAARNAPAQTEYISVKRTSADDFDPLGDDNEHGEEAFKAVDQEPGTAWDTESYKRSELGKAGVGITVDADPGVDARFLDVETPRSGWRATIYAALPGGGRPETLSGFTRVGGGRVARRRHRFKLSTDGQRYRYYLVWITKLRPEAQKAEVTEIEILRAKGT